MNALEQKLIDWFESDAIRSRCWAPRLFWNGAADGSPYGDFKVDPRELEVIFATILGEASECRQQLDTEKDGRGTFLAANARRHELPLLTPLQR